MECIKRAEWSSDAQYLMLRKKERSVQYIKEQNGAQILNIDCRECEKDLCNA